MLFNGTDNNEKRIYSFLSIGFHWEFESLGRCTCSVENDKETCASKYLFYSNEQRTKIKNNSTIITTYHYIFKSISTKRVERLQENSEALKQNRHELIILSFSPGLILKKTEVRKTHEFSEKSQIDN